MILIKETNTYIKSSADLMDKVTVTTLHRDLIKGHVIVIIPNRFDGVTDEKNAKKTYKLGFLYEMFSIVYPEMGKMEKHTVISERYHFWITYRQFNNIINDYESNKPFYVLTGIK